MAHKPEILAPAGDEDCFLAALAAGADAVYLGLKQFSARMEAKNFGVSQLARLINLAHGHGAKVYVAINTIIKPGELDQAFRLISRLATQARCDGLIFQDLAILALARQAGFKGMLAFSTLANFSTSKALEAAAALGAERVIIPRELDIDEMRILGGNCPPGLGLECFVHGALCYCVSGRCYWSSFLGGKSGLRGRCVQPCRRMYTRQNKGQPKRLFSCKDLEIGVLAKTLLTIPNLVSWKIEGRKKGPHYVYYATSAYRMLRDHPDDAQSRKMAAELLEMALGRPRTRARFLGHKIQIPMDADGQTSSGLFIGRTGISGNGETVLKTRIELLPKDYLRIGVEDEKWHSTLPVKRKIPAKGVFSLPVARHKTPKAGTPVYLLDRREPGLEKLLREWRQKLEELPLPQFCEITARPRLPETSPPLSLPDMLVGRKPLLRKRGAKKAEKPGLWLNSGSSRLSPGLAKEIYFWLPPDLWPENEEKVCDIIAILLKKGAQKFVCNAPWQIRLFPRDERLNLVAGPFCNTANCLAVEELARLGFKAAFASPELSRKDFLLLPRHSPIPLGLVIGGWWPVGISRFGITQIAPGETFQSPKGETFWLRQHGGTIWIFPGWKLDLGKKRQELLDAGYSFFAVLEEEKPASLPSLDRPGLFNWEGALL